METTTFALACTSVHSSPSSSSQSNEAMVVDGAVLGKPNSTAAAESHEAAQQRSQHTMRSCAEEDRSEAARPQSHRAQYLTGKGRIKNPSCAVSTVRVATSAKMARRMDGKTQKTPNIPRSMKYSMRL